MEEGQKVCGGYNMGFLRKDATLEIVFVSDEEDQSPADLSFYINFFKNIKGDGGRNPVFLEKGEEFPAVEDAGLFVLELGCGRRGNDFTEVQNHEIGGSDFHQGGIESLGDVHVLVQCAHLDSEQRHGRRDPDDPRLAARLPDWKPIHELPRIDTFSTVLKVMSPLLKHVEEMGLDPARVWSTDKGSVDQLDPQSAGQSLYFLHDPNHFTPSGHTLLADEIHENLREQGLLGG